MVARAAFAPRRKNAPWPAEKSAPGFLQWLRGRRCAIEGCANFMKIEAAHVDYAGDKGMGTKVSDKFAIPLCSEHHRQQHNKGWQTFEGTYSFNALDAAAAYWKAWPNRGRWEARNL